VFDQGTAPPAPRGADPLTPFFMTPPCRLTTHLTTMFSPRTLDRWALVGWSSPYTRPYQSTPCGFPNHPPPPTNHPCAHDSHVWSKKAPTRALSTGWCRSTTAWPSTAR
jgi:hypothetical protein